MGRILILLVAGIFPLNLASAWAQSASNETPAAKVKRTSPDKASDESPKTGKNRPMPGITPGREAAVMTFVKQHHPELEELLVQLRSSSSQEYEKAIRELFRASERLAQIQERDMAQYELELKLWQAQSRVQLLSARLKMSDSKDLREQLKQTLGEQLDLRLALLRRERDRLTDRVGDIDEQMKKLEGGRKQIINRQAELLAGSDKAGAGRPAAGKKNNVAERNPRAKEGASKPAANTPAGSPAGT